MRTGTDNEVLSNSSAGFNTSGLDILYTQVPHSDVLCSLDAYPRHMRVCFVLETTNFFRC